jgi:hypothetical protein
MSAPAAVLSRYAEARASFRAGDLPSAKATLSAIVTEAPLFAPALQLLAATLQLEARAAPQTDPAALAEARGLIERAVTAAQRSPSTLNDLGHFLASAEGSPAEALPVFAEAMRNALADAVECLEGLIACADRLGGTRVKEETVSLNRVFQAFQERIEVLSQLTE